MSTTTAGSSSSATTQQRLLQREKERHQRGQQFQGNNAFSFSLFNEPIKHEHEDATTKRIKDTLGEFSQIETYIATNPKLLVGISTREICRTKDNKVNKEKIEKIFHEMKNDIQPITALDDNDFSSHNNLNNVYQNSANSNTINLHSHSHNSSTINNCSVLIENTVEHRKEQNRLKDVITNQYSITDTFNKTYLNNNTNYNTNTNNGIELNTRHSDEDGISLDEVSENEFGSQILKLSSSKCNKRELFSIQDDNDSSQNNNYLDFVPRKKRKYSNDISEDKNLLVNCNNIKNEQDFFVKNDVNSVNTNNNCNNEYSKKNSNLSNELNEGDCDEESLKENKEDDKSSVSSSDSESSNSSSSSSSSEDEDDADEKSDFENKLSTGKKFTNLNKNFETNNESKKSIFKFECQNDCDTTKTLNSNEKLSKSNESSNLVQNQSQPAPKSWNLYEMYSTIKKTNDKMANAIKSPPITKASLKEAPVPDDKIKNVIDAVVRGECNENSYYSDSNDSNSPSSLSSQLSNEASIPTNKKTINSSSSTSSLEKFDKHENNNNININTNINNNNIINKRKKISNNLNSLEETSTIIEDLYLNKNSFIKSSLKTKDSSSNNINKQISTPEKKCTSLPSSTNRNNKEKVSKQDKFNKSFSPFSNVSTNKENNKSLTKSCKPQFIYNLSDIPKNLLCSIDLLQLKIPLKSKSQKESSKKETELKEKLREIDLDSKNLSSKSESTNKKIKENELQHNTSYKSKEKIDKKIDKSEKKSKKSKCSDDEDYDKNNEKRKDKKLKTNKFINEKESSSHSSKERVRDNTEKNNYEKLVKENKEKLKEDRDIIKHKNKSSKKDKDNKKQDKESLKKSIESNSKKDNKTSSSEYSLQNTLSNKSSLVSTSLNANSPFNKSSLDQALVKDNENLNHASSNNYNYSSNKDEIIKKDKSIDLSIKKDYNKEAIKELNSIKEVKNKDLNDKTTGSSEKNKKDLFLEFQNEGKQWKHNGDREKDLFKQYCKYLEAALYFIQSTHALEDISPDDRCFRLYKDTLKFMKTTLQNKFPKSKTLKTDSPSEQNKLIALGCKCMSITLFHLNKISYKEMRRSENFIRGQIQQITTTPDPNKTDQLVLTGKNITIPLVLYTTMQRQLEYLSRYNESYELWQQAENILEEDFVCKGYFDTLNLECGFLTMISSIDQLVNYTKTGLRLLNVDYS